MSYQLGYVHDARGAVRARPVFAHVVRRRVAGPLTRPLHVSRHPVGVRRQLYPGGRLIAPGTLLERSAAPMLGPLPVSMSPNDLAGLGFSFKPPKWARRAARAVGRVVAAPVTAAIRAGKFVAKHPVLTAEVVGGALLAPFALPALATAGGALLHAGVAAGGLLARGARALLPRGRSQPAGYIDQARSMDPALSQQLVNIAQATTAPMLAPRGVSAPSPLSIGPPAPDTGDSGGSSANPPPPPGSWFGPSPPPGTVYGPETQAEAAASAPPSSAGFGPLAIAAAALGYLALARGGRKRRGR